MEKLTYEALALLTDALMEAALDDYEDISRRMRPVDVLHARPPLAVIAADERLKAAWFGANATLSYAREAALAPFYAEDRARRERLKGDLDALYLASGWTELEFMAELERRVDAFTNEFVS